MGVFDKSEITEQMTYRHELVSFAFTELSFGAARDAVSQLEEYEHDARAEAAAAAAAALAARAAATAEAQLAWQAASSAHLDGLNAKRTQGKAREAEREALKKRARSL